MPQQNIGLIGIGLVGSALAERWLQLGWQVTGYDIDAGRCQALADLSGHIAPSPREVLNAADRIVLSLPTSQIASQVLHEVVDLLANKIIIDTTTGEPEEMVQLASEVVEHGGEYLDATIAGSSHQVRQGEVIVIAGGETAVVEACRPLFDSFAARVFHVGPCGAGARLKLVVNLVLGLNRAVLAEGLSFAAACGIDPRQALEILRAGPAASRVMDSKGEKMLAGDFTPQARLAQHLKDVRLILSAGASHAARLPLSALHANLLESLCQSGYGDLDNSVIIKAFEARSQ